MAKRGVRGNPLARHHNAITFGLFALLVLVLSTFRPALAQQPRHVLKICNRGDVSLGVGVAIDNESVLGLLLNLSRWQVYGWVQIEQRTCEEVYTEGSAKPAYLAFSYRNSSGDLMVYQPDLESNDETLYPIKPLLICADTVTAYRYGVKTTDAMSDCDGGYKVPFTMSFRPSGNRGGSQLTLTLRPLKVAGDRLTTKSPARSPRLFEPNTLNGYFSYMAGVPSKQVTRWLEGDGKWYFGDGTEVPYGADVFLDGYVLGKAVDLQGLAFVQTIKSQKLDILTTAAKRLSVYTEEPDGQIDIASVLLWNLDPARATVVEGAQMSARIPCRTSSPCVYNLSRRGSSTIVELPSSFLSLPIDNRSQIDGVRNGMLQVVRQVKETKPEIIGFHD